MDKSVQARAQEGIDHFVQTMGKMPVQLKTLSEMAPEVFAGYYDMRKWLMRDPPEGHLPIKYKHLIFSLIDVVLGNDPGAVNHARAGLRRGLTIGELLEGMVQVHMTAGVSVYGRSGYKVLDEVLASKEAKAQMRAAKKPRRVARRKKA